MIEDLITKFETERNQPLQTINELLDYYQHKYITGEININDYRNIFACLHNEGASSAFEYPKLEKEFW